MKRPRTALISFRNKKYSLEKKSSIKKEEENNDFEDSEDQYLSNKNFNLTDFVYTLFSKKIYAEIYYAWCKDCNEQKSVESAKYFRDELLGRNNKDIQIFNFKSLRVSKNFLSAFCGNLPPIQLKKLELQDNLINDECIHNLKSLISAKQLIYLNLASNQISTEGLKIIQNEIANSKFLKYLNFGVSEGSFRINNFSGDGGIILARILLKNKSIETLILQENLLGEDAGDKIGTSLIQNETLKKLVLSDNKIRNKGARSIIENANNLISIDLSDNDISPEVCYELKYLISHNKALKEIIWNGNYVGFKGINFIMSALNQKIKLKSLSLRNTSIGKKGIKCLAEGLINNTFLEIIDLSSNSITYQSFIYICDSLNTSQIKIFRCKNNLLGDDSMRYFADTILNKNSNSCLHSFDFSSCKIYDQGLIYILNGLTTNTKINRVKLRDNYFSHEIDYVILDFLELNTTLTHLDLTKNRFSFQCLQKVNKIIKRNRNIQNNKEPNKLLVELYSLKYENTKLNELRETLKNLENYNAKLKLNKIDLRQDYEIFRKENNEKINKKKKIIDEKTKDYNSKVSELENKRKELAKRKSENNLRIKELEDKYEKLLKEKDDAIKLNEKIKKDTENMQKEWNKKIEQLNDNIEQDKKNVDDLNKKIIEMEVKIDKIDDEIKEYENKNPELVKMIREEEKKNLDDEEFNSSGLNSLNKININNEINKKEISTEEKKEQNKVESKIDDNNKKYEEKKEIKDKNKADNKEKNSKKEGQKDTNNKKIIKKKSKKSNKKDE